ncbi:MAG: AAA family ATPase, partial [Bacillota bacterium]|nr:AAA family ATPase [Bacillota bacterium]
MNTWEFANSHLGQYKVHGQEILPMYCPYCQGGSSRDKYTFALNTDKLTWNCKRGTCGKQGHFSQLCKDFGEEADKDPLRTFETIAKPKKIYKPPKTEIKPTQSEVEKYLTKRGFSKATWERRGVGDDGNGNIAMPYYENGELVFMKFRPSHKPKKGEKKGWRESDGKPVLWGMDLCDLAKPLTLVEGEMDALSLDECGIENVVSVPSGAEDLTFIELCWDFLQRFKKYILWTDGDEPGQKLQRNLISRLGAAKCWVVVSERKDANEVLFFDGKDKVRELIENAIEVPISGLIRLSDIKAFDYKNAVKISSGIRGLDNVIGGWLLGQVTIWTGVNSSGKSTLLGQVMLKTIDQGYPICVFSGELPAAVFRYWIDLQAAGPNHLEMKLDPLKGANVAYPDQVVQEKIREWYKDKFFLVDALGTVTQDNLFEVFSYAAQRYGAKVFVIDNLMTMATGDKDFYRTQSEFVGKVVDFAHEYDCHVHLVAHPRKASGRITKMDVAGSGDITNRADNVLGVHRLTEEEKSKEQCDSVLEVFKNRFSGQQDVEIQLNFNPQCKRFYMASE